ncbi:MAG: hypothetical protein ACXVP0_08140, partial [Bacteroidia bacterium]
SMVLNAQTFIGKTEAEIRDFAGKNGYSLESANSDTIQTLRFHTMMYSDAKRPAHYLYEFNAKNICISYTIWTNDQPTKEAIQKDVEKLCQAKSASGGWVQKTNDKLYSWSYQGFESSFAFTSTEIKQ